MFAYLMLMFVIVQQVS
uniref:Uncharacterized protein n=1 Tax=Arundo donax TaxID=35708 RepID=A0A0A9H8A8_ARUDO